jgi:outer membrane immunogenic protein
MMKKFLMAATALVGLAGTAIAADLPIKAAPFQPAPVGFNWSGIYVGIHGGWEWSAFDPGLSTSSNNLFIQGLTDPGVLGANANGGFFGGHLGINTQQGSWVFGVRTDIDLSGLQGTLTDANGSVTHSVPWHGDLVGKLGFLVSPQILFYGVGGLAYGEIKDAASLNFTGVGVCVSTPSGPCALSADNVHVGWTAGLGLEYAINTNVLVGLEWDYTNLGTQGVTFVGNPNNLIGTGGTFNVNDKAAWNSVKGTLTVKF